MMSDVVCKEPVVNTIGRTTSRSARGAVRKANARKRSSATVRGSTGPQVDLRRSHQPDPPV